MSSRNDDHADTYQSLLSIPKVELHAHLNGCIRFNTLRELAAERGITLSEKHFSDKPSLSNDESIKPLYNKQPRSLQDCFDMFAALPAVVNDLKALRRITKECLDDFASQHITYLELRSTPKRLLKEHGKHENEVTSKQAYVETILSVMQQFQQSDETRYQQELLLQNDRKGEAPRLPLVCRFIVSVDRSQSCQEACENVNLAIALRKEQQYSGWIVGVDLGGNPTRNDFCDFQPYFEVARQAGLRVTLHTAEIPNEEETEAVFNFQPDRLGHALLLSQQHLQRLHELQIPVESCPTSNVMTLELHDHHDGSLVQGLQRHASLKRWLASRHPLCICTDDPAVFDTTLTQELQLVQMAYDVSTPRLVELILQSMDFCFCDNATREAVRERMRERMRAMGHL